MPYRKTTRIKLVTNSKSKLIPSLVVQSFVIADDAKITKPISEIKSISEIKKMVGINQA